MIPECPYCGRPGHCDVCPAKESKPIAYDHDIIECYKRGLLTIQEATRLQDDRRIEEIKAEY